MTLCTEKELFERKIRGLVAGNNGPVATDEGWKSHADLFGAYAVSFDPITARRLGIVPTNYFSPNDVFGERYDREVPGLNIQMIQRLREIREILIILATIERSLNVSNEELPGDNILQALNLKLPFEGDIYRKLYDLSDVERKDIFELFNTDRERALTLVSCIEMMLSLYQETDSTIDGRALAFYQQREWRLIHHVRLGMIWYCLGDQPDFRNPHAKVRQAEIRRLRRITHETSGGVPREEAYFKHCWLLEAVDSTPIGESISSIIVPGRVRKSTLNEVRRRGCSANVIAAEDFGYIPGITPTGTNG
jgi:hypothetical protein